MMNCFRTSYPEFELTDLRKNPDYHTAWVVCNTFFMGELCCLNVDALNWQFLAEILWFQGNIKRKENKTLMIPLCL